ncbi:MAG: 4Fe-4S binding protein [Planctomycetota bacterium]|nr:MAG: 4Fe-4S binding protein [Planctomycetota bacterium]
MITAIKNYYHWLHGKWPAGQPDKLPQANEDGSTNVPGLWVVGDLTGIPLLKFSLDTGAKAVRQIHGSPEPKPAGGHDLVIIGGGVSGVAAAAEAAKLGLDYVILESADLFSTIANFPKGKPIYTYPKEMRPESELSVQGEVKEDLLEELRQQAKDRGITATKAKASHVQRHGDHLQVHLKAGEPLAARAVIVAIGRSGNYRRLEVSGEDLDKVSNRLHDPATYVGKHTLVVGGGDSACEAAVAIAEANAKAGHSEALVTLSYRRGELSRAKPDNVQAVHRLAEARHLRLLLGSEVERIEEASVSLKVKGQGQEKLENDAVLTLIGREAPLDFFRRSGVRVQREYSKAYWGFIAIFFAVVTLLYGMKGWLIGFEKLNYTSLNPANWLGGLVASADPQSLIGTTIISASAGPGFWVTLIYSGAVVAFGLDRILRRRTAYITAQTSLLALIQVLPLFIFPEVLLPWLHANGNLPEIITTNLFPGESWWRAYGFILAWPLLVWNIFTAEPLMWWLIIGFVQTGIIIPLLIWRWGKGAYCGWICSCGALAETMGDRHREKMPHGPLWNKLNMVGQALLALSILMLGLYILRWTTGFGDGILSGFDNLWKYLVDFFLAGALAVGLYFAYSGRVWCRFACPLAALMHIYTRFSRFRITVNQKKCISCNACTTVCHQGIDIMNFANKGEHMSDPQCVRCSACVQACPTGVLAFGTVDGQERITGLDKLVASPVLKREGMDDRMGKTGRGD